MMSNHAVAARTTGREATVDQPAVQVAEAELDQLAAALAGLLLSWWRRREQERAAGDEPAVEEVA